MRAGWWKILWALTLCGCGPVVPLGADSAVTRADALLGPAGGTLSVAGAALNIPPGALASDTAVVLRRLADPPSLPLHVQPLTAGFEVGPDQVALLGRARLELSYDDTGDTVVVVEQTAPCPLAVARDTAQPGTTAGNGAASFEITAFGRFALGVVDTEHCTSGVECPCEDCEGTSFCDGTTGACRVTPACDAACDCPGL